MKFVSLTFVMCLLWVIPIDGFSVESSQLMPLNRYFPQSWGTKDGLPHNSIHALAQTSNGYLWAGTWEGVARFNGQQFTVFTAARKQDYQTPAFEACITTSPATSYLWQETEAV